MHTVTVRARLAAPPAVCWPLIRDFAGLGVWHPLVADCRAVAGEQPIRAITTIDGAQIRERLLHVDDAGLCLEYGIESAPMPVSDYVGRIEVHADGENGGAGSAIVWSARFNAPDAAVDDLRNAITHIFSSGLDGLAAHLGS